MSPSNEQENHFKQPNLLGEKVRKEDELLLLLPSFEPEIGTNISTSIVVLEDVKEIGTNTCRISFNNRTCT